MLHHDDDNDDGRDSDSSDEFELSGLDEDKEITAGDDEQNQAHSVGSGSEDYSSGNDDDNASSDSIDDDSGEIDDEEEEAEDDNDGGGSELVVIDSKARKREYSDFDGQFIAADTSLWALKGREETKIGHFSSALDGAILSDEDHKRIKKGLKVSISFHFTTS